MRISDWSSDVCSSDLWDSDLRDQSSIRPLVDFLKNSDAMIAPIYRRVATIESFAYFANQWKTYKNHTIGYFSFHGSKGSLSLGKEKLNLSALGKLLEGSCQGKHIILSSCQTLSVQKEVLEAFRKQTDRKSTRLNSSH